jgi:hypothetical protein
MARCLHTKKVKFTLKEYPNMTFEQCAVCFKMRQFLPVLARKWGTIDEHTPDKARALIESTGKRIFDENAAYNGGRDVYFE